MTGIAAEQTCTDQVIGADTDQPERLAARGFQLRLLTRFKGRQRRQRGIHLVTEDPQVASTNTPVGIGVETQAGQ